MDIEPKDLFFSKEAADFLGISVQRLNKLTKDNTIKPFKKNSSGTVYLLQELQKRKDELAIFKEKEPISYQGAEGMFRINTPIRQEALNFSTLMLSLNITEKKLSPIFDNLSQSLDISSAIIDDLIRWSTALDINASTLQSNYETAKQEFCRLHETDEIIKIGDTEYPSLLAETEEAPRFLYLRGDFSLLHDTRTIALVGSRNASDKGKENTRRVAATLGHNGIIVVSGLAKGIDATAHKTALENGYKTIAVIGTNLNQYYPSENKNIQMEIEKKGLVISQFSPALKTERWFFPLRNGVMSGLSRATVIMEAGETSGALTQATYAAKQGRLVLIPQNVFSDPSISWPHSLVRKGAIVVRTPKEIISTLSERLSSTGNERMATPDLFADDINSGMFIAEEAEYSAD